MDKSEILVLLEFVLESIELIEKRFKKIKSVDDFLTEDGLLILDAISMRLQAVGEALKNIDKKDKEFLLQVADKRVLEQNYKNKRNNFSSLYKFRCRNCLYDLR